MKHPFELEIFELEGIELDFFEPLTDESSQLVMGGFNATTEYVTANLGEAGEEGGIGHGFTTNYATINQGEAAEEGGGLSHY